MPTRNVTLPDHLNDFIESGIASGRFSDASAVVSEGLQLLEQHEQEQQAKLEWLRAAVKEGFDAIDKGDYITLRSEEELADFFDEMREGILAEGAGQSKVG